MMYLTPRPFFVWILVIGLTLFQAYAPFSEASEYHSQQALDALKKKIDKLQQRLANDRRNEQKVNVNLQEIEQQSVKLERERIHSNQRLENLQVQKMQTNAALFVLEGDDQQIQNHLTQVAVSGFSLAQKDSISILLSDRSPSESFRSLRLHRYLIDSQNRRLEGIRERKKQIAQTINQLTAQTQSIDNELEKLQQNRAQLKKLEESRQRQLKQIRSSLSNDEQQMKRFKEQERELHALLTSLQREPTSKNNTVAQTHTKNNPSVPSKNAIAGGFDKNSFDKNKGRLKMPVVGEVTKKFGQVRLESGLKWDGLMLKTQQGQSVNAIYHGQVVFSDWFGSYGQLLVLDHGDGYMSLYGHNQLLQVQIGHTVVAGEQIALSGNTGGLSEPGLYFQIRHNGIPADPLRWCRL